MQDFVFPRNPAIANATSDLPFMGLVAVMINGVQMEQKVSAPTSYSLIMVPTRICTGSSVIAADTFTLTMPTHSQNAFMRMRPSPMMRPISLKKVFLVRS